MSHNHDTNHQTTTVHGDTVVPFEKTAKKSLRRDVSVAPSQHTSLKFRKPNKNDYFRVSDRPEHAPFPASIWEHNDGNVYLVAPDATVTARLGKKVTEIVVYVAYNSDNETYLTYRKVSSHPASRSAADAFARAKTRWVNMVWNSQAYDIEAQEYPGLVANFPTENIDTLIEQCEHYAEGLVIEDMDHPTMRKLVHGQ